MLSSWLLSQHMNYYNKKPFSQFWTPAPRTALVLTDHFRAIAAAALPEIVLGEAAREPRVFRALRWAAQLNIFVGAESFGEEYRDSVGSVGLRLCRENQLVQIVGLGLNPSLGLICCHILLLTHSRSRLCGLSFRWRPRELGSVHYMGVSYAATSYICPYCQMLF